MLLSWIIYVAIATILAYCTLHIVICNVCNTSTTLRHTCTVMTQSYDCSEYQPWPKPTEPLLTRAITDQTIPKCPMYHSICALQTGPNDSETGANVFLFPPHRTHSVFQMGLIWANPINRANNFENSSIWPKCHVLGPNGPAKVMINWEGTNGNWKKTEDNLSTPPPSFLLSLIRLIWKWSLENWESEVSINFIGTCGNFFSQDMGCYDTTITVCYGSGHFWVFEFWNPIRPKP